MLSMKSWKRWSQRIPGPLRMALTWAAAGALVGALIEVTENVAPGSLPFARLVDIWPPVLAILGFSGGALCSAALRLAGTRRR